MVNAPRVEPSRVRGVTLHHQLDVKDWERGHLTAGELDAGFPFAVRRYFLVYGVPSRETRGEHAHRACHQFLVAVKGSLCVAADDGRAQQEFLLDRPSLGLYLPPMTWGAQYRYTADAVLLVFASHAYDAADYIRDRAEFAALAARRLTN
jgi:UDP-2-acetamido-3-amino-2,3-dideoxy-glucuronate N-acetyltransferase